MMPIIVESCRGCPFFRTTLLAALAGQDGECHCGTPPVRMLPVGRGIASTVPQWCPLRLGRAVVALREDN